MGQGTTRSLVLDAGALIAIERANRAVLALVAVAAESGADVVIPAGVIGQVWRSGARQARVARVIGAAETIVEPLDLEVARAAGELCGTSRTNDVIDASVAIAGRRIGATVVTSDPDDLRHLDPALDLYVV